MAAISYLTGGERPTAALMNTLFEALDGKLTKLLSGKSFYYAQAAALPASLSGKAFFFTSGVALYSRRVPGYIEDGTDTIRNWVARPYQHEQFTDAVDAIDLAEVTTDAVKRIAVIGDFDSGVYDGLPESTGVGFLEWSLQTHTLDAHIATNMVVSAPGSGYAINDVLSFSGGTGGAASVKVTAVDGDGGVTAFTVLSAGAYSVAPASPNALEDGAGAGVQMTADFNLTTLYLRESSSKPPEKFYRFAVAEIILEGVTSLDLPAEYDKYRCFRLHNLNHADATVNFADEYSVTLKPMQCATVRRDEPTGEDANYRAGWNYFFKFEPGDPRFYWFHPKSGAPASNAMQANNLTNPACVLDWVNYLTRDMAAGIYAAWKQDQTVQADVDAAANGFGDPSVTTTLLGDLLHHRGDLLIVRSSKTETDSITGDPVLTFETVTFNGYTTLVADFAAKQLGVAVDGNGDYVISNDDGDNDVYLVPISTNLLKTGDTRPTIVALPRTIESAVLENPDYSTLSNTGPELIKHATLSTSTDSRTWGDVDGGSHVVTGDPKQTLAWNTRATALALHGIHAITVADLLTLDYWGDPSQAGQNSTYVTITDRALRLTSSGLVLVYKETDSSLPVGDTSSQEYLDWAQLKRGAAQDKVIRFRGHGWGYWSATNGSRDSGFLISRYGRYRVSATYVDEVAGIDGADFDVTTLGATETEIKQLGRVKPANVGLTDSAGRFAICTHPGDYLAAFLYHKATKTPTEFGALFAASSVAGINGGSSPVVQGATVAPLAMALLPEMYNALARAVNAVTSGTALQWATLRFSLFGDYISLDSASTEGNDPLTGLPISGGPLLTRRSLFDWRADINDPALESGIGVPGTYYRVSVAGTTDLDGVNDWAANDYAYFNTSGAWEKRTSGTLGTTPAWLTDRHDPGDDYRFPVPMNCWKVFEPGCQMEAFCEQLGITIKTVDDFPGGIDNDGNPQPFSYFAAKRSLPVVFYTYVTTGCENLTGEWTTSFPNSSPTGSRTWVFEGAVSISGSMSCEKLSTAAIASGLVSGSHCVGTWDPTGANPDFTGKAPGDYYLANDGSGKYFLYGSIGAGNLFSFSGHAAATQGVGRAFLPSAEAVDLTALADLRWVDVTDIRTVIESLFELKFSWIKVGIPLELRYFEDPVEPSALFQRTSVDTDKEFTANWVQLAGIPDPSGVPTADYTSTNGGALFVVVPAGAGDDGGSPGTLIKFCASDDPAKALWRADYLVRFARGWGTFDLKNPPAVIMSSSIKGSGSSFLLFEQRSVNLTVNTAGTFSPLFHISTAPGTGAGSGNDPDAFVPESMWAAYEMTSSNINLIQQLYNGETNPADQRMTLAVNQVLGAAQAAFDIPIKLTGQGLWTSEERWWADSAANFYAFSAAGVRPMVYHSAPADQTLAAGTGLTFIAAGLNESYLGTFDVRYPVIAL